MSRGRSKRMKRQVGEPLRVRNQLLEKGRLGVRYKKKKRRCFQTFYRSSWSWYVFKGKILKYIEISQILCFI